MLHQDVVVVAFRRLQPGIAGLDAFGCGVGIDDLRGNKIGKVRSGDPHSEHSSQVRISLDSVLQLNTRENIDVACAAPHRSSRLEIDAGVQIDLFCEVVIAGRLKPDAGLQTQLAKANRVHQVACINALIRVKVGRHGLQDARILLAASSSSRFRRSKTK